MSKSDSPSSFSRMRSPLRRRKSRTQPILSAGSPPSMRLSAIAGFQFGKPLKSRTRAHTRSLRPLTTLETKTRAMDHLAPLARRGAAARRRGAVRVFLRRRLLADALHVARLADEARHFGEAPALDPDVGQERIDERGLDAIAKRRVDHFVGSAAPAISVRMTAIEAVDLKDADALDLLHGLHALAHDAFDAVEQLAPEQRRTRRLAQHV